MHEYMQIITKKDQEKTFISCDPRYGNGTMILYEPSEGIQVYYADFLMNGPYRYQGEYDKTNTLDINYCLSGQYECEFADGSIMYICDGDFSLASGKGYIVQSDCSYKRYQGISIYVDVEKVKNSLRQIIRCETIDLHSLLCKNLSGKTCVIAKPGRKILHIFQELYRLPKKYQLDYIRIKIFELILLIYTGGFEYEESTVQNYTRNLVNAAKNTRKWIEFHYAERITIKEMARRNFVNANQLMQCFKYIYGMTINECLQTVRVTKAANFLVDSDLKVTDIAHAVGYASTSKFSQFFKRFYKISPLQFRNSMRKK